MEKSIARLPRPQRALFTWNSGTELESTWSVLKVMTPKGPTCHDMFGARSLLEIAYNLWLAQTRFVLHNVIFGFLLCQIMISFITTSTFKSTSIRKEYEIQQFQPFVFFIVINCNDTHNREFLREASAYWVSSQMGVAVTYVC